MRKNIFSGVFLSVLTVSFIFVFYPSATESSHSDTFVTGQKEYISDSQAKSTDLVPFTLDGYSFSRVRNSVLSSGAPEDKNIMGTSSDMADSTKDDASPAIGGKSINEKKQTKEMNAVSAVHRRGLLRTAKNTAIDTPVSGAVGLGVAQAVLTGSQVNPPLASDQEIPTEEVLQTVGSYENLKRLLENTSSSGGYGEDVFFSGLPMVMMRASAFGNNMALADANGVEATAAEDTANYSTTNAQVEGVDEADIVKTDGTYIYQVNRDRVVIVKAFPSENMEVAGTLNYGSDKGFSPQEMYVDEDHLVVIGSTRRNWNYPLYKGSIGGTMMSMPFCYYPMDIMKAIIYDIRDKSNIKQVRELELNGAYVSSRKVGQSLYLIANKHLYFWRGREIDEPKPSYRDSVAGDGFTEIDYLNIRYFPDFVEPSYLIVAGLNLDCPNEAASVASYLGSGQNIYASTQNLYVAVTSYPHHKTPGKPIPVIGVLPILDMCSTKIYKFGMSEGVLTYASAGQAPGTILNQFSMDEYDGCFRIATTQGDVWGSGKNASKNNVYIFDSHMNVAGKLEGIAPGEKIYSVRFIGGRGYMVTFKNVDPFFVLDLKDPRNPAILGKLKIPGYSNYLHPYDENHVIGFGKDTVEAWGTAFYMGMKMAIFDVSDVRRPVEMFNEKIGDRGTDSDLLRNPKALLFSREKNLLSFPVRIMEVDGNSHVPGANFLEYGSFSFQGAYVYNIDLVSGFALKGRITHFDKEDSVNASNYWYDGDKNIDRILYIDDTLYTSSMGMIRANAISDLQETGSLEIE